MYLYTQGDAIGLGYIWLTANNTEGQGWTFVIDRLIGAVHRTALAGVTIIILLLTVPYWYLISKIMNDEIFDNITNFIELQRWKYPFELNKTTKIENDLGITGDEAVEFILAFGKTFNVDVSNFKAADYFDSEGDKILPAIIIFFICKKRIKKKELLLGDLEQAVKARRLDDSTIGKT